MEESKNTRPVEYREDEPIALPVYIVVFSFLLSLLAVLLASLKKRK